MKTFSIAELEQFTLIKAHTFRTWEHRNEIMKSQRKATNIRFYTIDDLDYLLDFALLNRFGVKISVLAGLNKQEIKERVLQLGGDAIKQERTINHLILYTFSLKVEDFELILDSSISFWGIDTVVENIIVPFLERIQLYSYQGRTSIEYHLIVTILRKKFIMAIEQAKVNAVEEKKAMLFLPTAEHFDLFLLYMCYRLKMAGFTIFYLGTDITIKNLQLLMKSHQPHFLVTYCSSNLHDKHCLHQYAEASSGAKLVVGTHSRYKSLVHPNMQISCYKKIDEDLLALYHDSSKKEMTEDIH